MISQQDIQILSRDGKPAFIIVPYARWQAINREQPPSTLIPSEVQDLHLKVGVSLIAAWRRYFKITQRELAEKLGMSQSAVAQIERPGTRNRRQTLQKIADALNLDIQQLTEKSSSKTANSPEHSE